MGLRYLTDCVSANGDDITAMVDQAREVSYRTARAKIGEYGLSIVFGQYDWRHRPRDLTLKHDWHVRYYRSRYRGKPVYYVVHSAIEHVFG